MMLDLGPYTFDALNDSVDLPASDRGHTYVVSVEGTSTQTLQFQDSYDGGTTYAPIALFGDNGSIVTNLNGVPHLLTTHHLRQGFGFVRPRLRCTAFTSGSLTVRVWIVPVARAFQYST